MLESILKNRKLIDPLYRLKVSLRSSICIFLKNKGYKKKSKTTDILGCSFEEFKLHIENQFKDWMNWDNRALYNGTLNYGWDIDHIEPLSTAINEADIIRLCHYTNLQPLCSYTNRVLKNGKTNFYS